MFRQLKTLIKNRDKKVGIIVQARCKSSRLTNKVLEKIGDDTVLELIIKRVRRCENINKIIIATTNNKEDDKIEAIAKKNNVDVVRGEEEDVLSRFIVANNKIKCSVIVRITADCPFIDPEVIDDAIKKYNELKLDYLTNTEPPTYPDGLDVEVFSAKCLEEANKNSRSKEEREHVTPWIKKNSLIKKDRMINKKDYSQIRVTIDYKEDLEVVRKIEKELGGEKNITLEKLEMLYERNNKIYSMNKHIKRNDGAEKNNTEKQWEKAKKLIPGGTMLFSKRPELYLPQGWPTYYETATDCTIYDLEGRKYRDVSVMGMGTNILGYSNNEVNEAVINTVRKGNMTTLNCPEEVELAEKLVAIHPWADMAHFARTGGEANAVAIRLARAATGRNAVAVCGYHGWHDWYLAANLKSDSELSEHVMPGLQTCGVSKSLEGTVLAFNYNDYEAIERIAYDNELAAIKMEVERTIKPDEGFLSKIRKLCDSKKIVLIFDECTSGFRETYGGLHLKYGIYPDMAIYGKAIGNGYAITATIGKRSIMESAQKSFISSTFWTERVGPTAALATLNVMEDLKSWKIISNKGQQIKNSWREIAKRNDLSINVLGIDALPGYTFKSKDHNKYKTYITQEMLKKGFLATTNCYVSLAHTESVLEEYFEELNKVFQNISICENEGRDINLMLEGNESIKGFGRLN